MTSFVDTTLSGLQNAFRHKLEERASQQRHYGEVLNAVEKVVDGTDSRIRLVSGYKKKLHDGVKTALEFADELVARIPGTIEISSSNFVSDPYVNAFFVNANDLHTIFNHSSEMQDFMEDCGSHEDSQCCVLLCMQKTEKSILGMDLSGDILKKDVQQTAVSFSDHRIYSPAPTEAATREGLKECLLGGLVTNALERIMQDKVKNHRLQSDRQMLHVKLRHLEYKSRSTHQGSRIHADLTNEIEDIRQKLRVIENKLMSARPATPQESLNHVNGVLKQPDNYIQLSKSTFRLDKMGIRIDKSSSRPCNNIDLTEVVIGEASPRVVTLARFPVEEFSSQAEFQAHRTFS